MNKKNTAQSVRQKLLNRAKSEGRPFGDLLLYYGIERFLYRLSISCYRNNFFLKGALMLVVWQELSPRPTRDIDFLGRTDNSTANIENIMREICQIPYEPDGVEWLSESFKVTETQKSQAYSGVRVSFRGKLDTAIIPMQIDIGFADIIHPKPANIDYPSLLNMPKPQLLGYTPESVIAEKIHAVVTLGELNSRMKDYFDIWFLSRQFEFSGKHLCAAITKTFAARKSPFSALAMPSIFNESISNQNKKAQWTSFLQQSKLQEMPELPSFKAVIDAISAFVLPPISAISAQQPFPKKWNNTAWV